MGATNIGNQRIIFKFLTPLDSDNLDAGFQDVFSLGVYSGYDLSKIDDTHINIGIGKAIISDGTYTAIVESRQNINQVLSSSTPYIIIRWVYAATEDWYADFTAVSQANILSTDIVLGKAIYDGPTLNNIEISKKTIPNKVLFDDLENRLKVVENPIAVVLEVIVKPGHIILSDGVKYSWSMEQTVNILTADATHPRIDIITVNLSGNLEVVAGTPSASPVAPSYSGKFGLAEVYVGANATKIYQENISDVRSWFTMPFNISSVLEVTDNRYHIKNVADSKEQKLKERLENSENKNLEQEIRLGYLEQRQQFPSSTLLDMFMNTDLMADFETNSNKVVDVLDETDFNNNWKHRNGQPNYKNGYIRNTKQYYRMEEIDEYDLEGIGQKYKGCISRWDTTNECYWFISQAGTNGIGELIKLSKNMVDNKVYVLNRWYLEAGGASTNWSGIDVDITNQVLFITLYGNGAAGGVMALKINADSTLGLKNKVVGGTIEHPNTSFPTKNWSDIDGTNTYDWSAYEPGDTGSYINDITVWDSNDIALLCCAVGTPAPTKLQMEGRAFTNGNLASPTNLDITNLENYIVGDDIYGRGLIRNGDDLWIKINDATKMYSLIYSIDVTTGIKNNKLYRINGRFESVRSNIKTDSISEGITISNTEDFLEIVSTLSNGKFIAKRSLKNSLWAENQICGEFKMLADGTSVPNAPWSCMIDSSGNFWTAETNKTAQTCKIYRYEIDGTIKSVTVTGATSLWSSIIDMTTDGTNVWLLGYDGINYEVFKGLMSYLVGQLGTSGDGSNTINLDDGVNWTIASGIGIGYTTTLLRGICYDGDNNILYISHFGNSPKIHTLSVDGTEFIQGVYRITTTGYEYYYGITYKNDKFFICDSDENDYICNHINVLNKGKSLDPDKFREHLYRMPTDFDDVYNLNHRMLSFHNNDLVNVDVSKKKFYTIKTLENSDVLQVQSHLDEFNIKNAIDNIASVKKIEERYFGPEEYEDIRDCPDKYYSVIKSVNGDVLILNLDDFLSERTSSGLNRYTPSKIREYFFDTATNYLLESADDIVVERDMLFVSSTYRNYGALFFVDLKNGKSMWTTENSTACGQTFQGSLSERNQAKTYAGAVNLELKIEDKIRSLFAKTFSKDDASDYSGENFKTFLLMGGDSGVDLLVIDWCANGNRTPVKVWNNLFNFPTIGESATWISPDGTVFAGDFNTGALYYGNKKVWEINEDNCFNYLNSEKCTEIGTNICKSSIYSISENSRVWKNGIGNWRHILLIGTCENAVLVDVENENSEIVYNSACNYLDLFEDNIMLLNEDLINPKIILNKKIRFDNKHNQFQNQKLLEFIDHKSIPMFNTKRKIEIEKGLTEFESGMTQFISSVVVNNKVLIAYQDAGDSYKGKFVIYDEFGNVIKGTTVFSSNSTRYTSCAVVNNKVFIVYRNHITNDGEFVIYDEFGNLLKNATVFDTNDITFTCCTGINNKIFIFYQNNGLTETNFVIYDENGDLVKSKGTLFNWDREHLSCMTMNNKVYIGWQMGSDTGYMYKYDEYGNKEDELNFSGVNSVQYISIANIENKIFIAYQDSTDSFKGKFVIYNEDLTIFKTTTVFENNHVKAIDCVNINGKIIITYQDFTSTNDGKFVIYDEFGNKLEDTITFYNGGVSETVCVNVNNKLFLSCTGYGVYNFLGNFIIYGSVENNKRYLNYSKLFNILFLSEGYTQGTFLYHFPEINECLYESINNELLYNPRNAHYIQNAILQNGEKCDPLDKDDVDISYVNGNVRHWRIESVQNGTLTNGSAVVTGLTSTINLDVGMDISGTGIPSSTTIASIDSTTQITMSQNATDDGVKSLTFSNDELYNVLDKDGTKEGYLKWTNIVNFNVCGVQFTKDVDCGRCKVSMFNKTDKIEKTGTLNSSNTISSLSQTSDLEVGMLVVEANIPDNTRIQSIISSTQILLTNPTGGNGSYNITFYDDELNSVSKIERTGNTHTNTTIDNLSTTTDLEVDMIVIGNGIDRDTRIVSIDTAAQITISKPATSTIVDNPLIFYSKNTFGKLIDLYFTSKEEFVYWLTLNIEKEYIIIVEHNSDKNSSSSDELLKMKKYLTVENLNTSEVNTVLKLWHSDHTSTLFNFDLICNDTIVLEKQMTFNGDGNATEFTLSGDDRAYEPAMFSVDGGSSWLYPEDYLLSWGTNSPDFDNETVDNNGYFTVKFDTAPIVGTNNVTIKYVPKMNTYKTIRTIKHPYKGSFRDDRKNVRLLDDCVELLR